MNVILQGLSVSVMGLALTFAALGLLVLVMIVLQRVFGAREPTPQGPELDGMLVCSALTRDTENQEIAAAIAVALAQLRSLEICQSGLGETLEAGRGRWWLMGRIPVQPMGIPRSGGRG